MEGDNVGLDRWLLDEVGALGFDDGGLVRADVQTPGAEGLARAQAQGFLGPFAWLEQTVDLRGDIQLRYPGAKTVLVVVKNYFTGHHEEWVSPDELVRGAKVSRYAWGGDYHKGMRRRLRKLRESLLTRAPSTDDQVWIFNDIDPVAERAWAEAAGLGFLGKSGLFIHRRFGTWTFLGGLITTIDLAAPPPRVMVRNCGTCTACLDACPTGALVEPRLLDANRCLTTWNIERPLDQEADAGHLVGHGWAAGCDVCQEVCPWNRFENVTTESRYAPKPGHVVLTPDTVPADLTGSPLGRPGPAGLRRSVERALSGRRPPESAPPVTGDAGPQPPPVAGLTAVEPGANRSARSCAQRRGE